MAGTLDLVQRAYLGTEVRDDVLYFNPAPIDELDGLEISMQVRRTPMVVSLHGAQLTVRTRVHGFTQPIRVSVGGVERQLGQDESFTFTLPGRGASRDGSIGAGNSHISRATAH